MNCKTWKLKSGLKKFIIEIKSGTLVFGGIKWEHWPEMSYTKKDFTFCQITRHFKAKALPIYN